MRVTAGFILLIVLIYFIGELLALPINLRLFGILILLALGLIIWVFSRVKEKRDASLLEKSIKAQAESHVTDVRPGKKEEIEQLTVQLTSAIESLKKSKLGKSKRGRSALYALPWYMFIGPPGAGKTTAIVNSGLKFPVGQERIQGVGGTRNCDWFFSDTAILLDTAGRYTTEEEDQDEWLTFLNILKKHRRRQPINGVIVGVSIADLMHSKLEDVEWHAVNIRRRIDELIEHLEVRFPVFLAFTKCDLVQGFVSFFEEMDRRERAQIWGCTLTKEQREDSDPRAVFEQENKELFSSLLDMRLQRMSSTMNRETRQNVYVFPLEFAAAQDNLAHFVEKVLQPNPYKENPIFRGFYYTSGTQEGMPIDRVIQAIAGQFDLPPTFVGQLQPEIEKKSYFIKDLFTNVVIPDKEMVEQTSRAANYQRMLRQIGVLSAFVLLVLFVLSVSTTFVSNKRMLNEAVRKSEAVEEIYTPSSSVSELISYSDLTALDQLRRNIIDLERTDSWLDWGMYQGDKVLPAMRALYFQKAQVLIDRHAHRTLTNQLESAVQVSDSAQTDLLDPSTSGADSLRQVVYTSLKAYLLLGNEAGRLADDMEKDFLESQLNAMLRVRSAPDFPGSPDSLIHDQLAFYIDGLRDGLTPGFENNPVILQEVRSRIRQSPSVRDVYVRLKLEGRAMYPPVTLNSTLEGQYTSIFESRHEVPGLFTKEAWDNYIQEEITIASEDPGKADWVFNIAEEDLPDIMRDTQRMTQELYRLYFRDYQRAWWDFLSGISYRASDDVIEVSDQLRTVSNLVASPLQILVNRVADETRFGIDLPGTEEAEGGIRETVQRLMGAGERAADLLEQGPAGYYQDTNTQFADIHRMSTSGTGQESTEGLTQVLTGLANISSVLEGIRSDPGTKAMEEAVKVIEQEGGELPAANRGIQNWLNTLQPTTAGRIRNLFEGPIEIAWTSVLGAAQHQLNNRWQEEIYNAYRQNLEPYYPFSRSGGEDAFFDEVEKFFGLQGTLSAFVDNELQPFLRPNTTSPREWMGYGIRLSSSAQTVLQWAQTMQEGFLRSNTFRMDFKLEPTRQPSPVGIVERVSLTIDGQEYRYTLGRIFPQNITWPDRTSAQGATLAIFPIDGQPESIRFDGPWGWLKLLNEAQIHRTGRSRFDVVWTFEQYELEVFFTVEVTNSAAGNLLETPRSFFTVIVPQTLN